MTNIKKFTQYAAMRLLAASLLLASCERQASDKTDINHSKNDNNSIEVNESNAFIDENLAEPKPAIEIIVPIQHVDGRILGDVQLIQGAQAVLVRAKIDGLKKGWHSFHLHQTGSCDKDFSSAGGHLKTQDQSHGVLSVDGPHVGDLPNIYSYYSRAYAEFFASSIAIEPGKSGEYLLDEDGFAIILHENSDDHLSQPTGGGGKRIACGQYPLADPPKPIP